MRYKMFLLTIQMVQKGCVPQSTFASYPTATRTSSLNQPIYNRRQPKIKSWTTSHWNSCHFRHFVKMRTYTTICSLHHYSVQSQLVHGGFFFFRAWNWGQVASAMIRFKFKIRLIHTTQIRIALGSRSFPLPAFNRTEKSTVQPITRIKFNMLISFKKEKLRKWFQHLIWLNPYQIETKSKQKLHLKVEIEIKLEPKTQQSNSLSHLLSKAEPWPSQATTIAIKV